MTITTPPGNRRRRIPALVLCFVLVAIAGLTPALARGRQDSRHDRRHHRHDHRVAEACRSCGHAHEIRHERFVIPHRVDGRYARAYRPYFWTNVYDPVHRHHHAVYRFPVQRLHGPVYEPYVYCGARLFDGGGTITYHGRRLSVSFGW